MTEANPIIFTDDAVGYQNSHPHNDRGTRIFEHCESGDHILMQIPSRLPETGSRSESRYQDEGLMADEYEDYTAKSRSRQVDSPHSNTPKIK